MQALTGAWQFGRFTLEPDRRILLADGVPVPLNARAFDILELLVRCHGRVVSRDEIVAHVWRGVTVGENNLAVQMSSLRRTLGDQGGQAPLIVNLPGRGYRLTADVLEPCSRPGERVLVAPVEVRDPEGLVSVATKHRRPSRLLWIVAFCVVLVSGIAVAIDEISSVYYFSKQGSLPDARLTVAVQQFGSSGDDAQIAGLAVGYREALLGRLAEFEDIAVFPEGDRIAARLSPHFVLSGLIQNRGAENSLLIRLVQEPNGELLYSRNFPLPMQVTASDQARTAIQILGDLRPSLFQAEFKRRSGPPRDAVDLAIAAYEAADVGSQSAPMENALHLAKEAADAAPLSRPIRSLYAYLLMEHMVYGSALAGDEDGWKALRIMDQVLHERPFNLIYLYRRVFALEALGRIDDAEATVNFALRLDPDNPWIKSKSGEIDLLRGNFSMARAILIPDPNDAQDSTLAVIEFAEGHYADCLKEIRSVIAATPDAFSSPYNILLEVSALSQADRIAEAKALLASVLAKLPQDLRSVSAQRQYTYVLPNAAWHQFQIGLLRAGLEH